MIKKIISWFVDNPVISNLLMLMIIIGGAMTISSLKMEVFPSFELDAITVSVVFLRLILLALVQHHSVR